MVQINFSLKEVNCKVVFYGPGLSGKTTNLEVVHARAPSGSTGDLTSIATEGDRTLFFDFLPLDLGQVAGMKTRFQIYTVPGQVYYNSTRKLVLQGADGVVFVADSKRGKMQENLESLQNLIDNLKEFGLDINTIPLVLQLNKRDLPEVYTVDEMNQALNRWNAPHFEAVARDGVGVFPTLKCLAGLVLDSLNRQHGAAPVSRGGATATSGRSGAIAAGGGAGRTQAAMVAAARSAPVQVRGPAAGATATIARPAAVQVRGPQTLPQPVPKPMAASASGGGKRGGKLAVGIVILGALAAGAWYLWSSGILG